MRVILHATTLAALLALAGSAPPARARGTAFQEERQSATRPKRIRIAGDVMADKLMHRVKPDYPEEAKKAHKKGKVRLQILIAEDGKVIDAKPVEGDPILAKAALDAVLQWRYQPTTLSGDPVQVETDVEIKFR